MEFKGTKGEWIAKYGSESETQIICNGLRIAEAKHYKFDGLNDPSTEEGRANAKLIASSPILLKEHLMDLKHLYTWRSKLINAGLRGDVLWNEYTDMIDAKEEAINKALN